MRSCKASLRNRHLGNVPIEEVPLRNKASPTCLEREDHTTTASDGLCDVEIGLGPVSILLYVDDLVITGVDLGEIDRVKLQLAASFDMKDLGDLHYFLGIEVICTPEGILINQRHYVLSMLFKFGMTDCKSVSTPLDRTVKLCPTNCRKPHILDNHSTRPQLSGRGDQSVHGATYQGAPSVCATRTSIRKRH